VEAKPNSNSLRVDPPSVFFRTTLLLYLFGKPIVSNNKKQQQTTTTTKSTTTHMPETQIPEESNCPTSESYSLPPDLPSKNKNTLKTHTHTKLLTLNCAIRYHTFLEGKNSTTFSHLLEPLKCGVISSMTVVGVVVVVVVIVMQQSTMLVVIVPYVLGLLKPCLYVYRGCLNR
jgi:hypothetical protein